VVTVQLVRSPLASARALLAVLAATLLLAVAGTPVSAATKPAPTTTSSTIPPEPKAYVVVDAGTGDVLLAKDDRTPLPPASLTKVLTAVAAAPLLDRAGTTPISARAAGQPANKVGALEGQAWPTDIALHVMLMQSANDLAMALAEQAGGSAETFQEVLARAADRLGMDDHPVLHDPAGLDDDLSIDGGNLVSARDLAIATRALLDDPWLAPIVATPRFGFTDPAGIVHDAVNHNKLVLSGGYPGAVGVKTGYTRRAGRTLIAAARRDGRTLIAVVLNVYDTYGWARNLLDQGFATPEGAGSPAGRLGPPVRLQPKDLLPSRAAAATATTPSSGTPIAATPVAARTGRQIPALPAIAVGATILAVASAFVTRARRRAAADYRVVRRRRISP
jgi:D-alanyl-D-alanine carboxypeptidase (penicillin-binding protein 5/6)